MTTLAGFRRQYPQYDDLSDQQLADRLYASRYSDMDRSDFDERIGLRRSGGQRFLRTMGAANSALAAFQTATNPLAPLMALPAFALSDSGEARAFRHGATFGFEDELAGVTSGAIDTASGERGFSDSYQQTADSARLELERAREARPTSTMMAESAGAAASGAGAGGTVLRTGASLPRVMAVSAAETGLYGQGQAEGSLTERLPSAGGYAAMGAVAPPVLAGAGRAAAATARPVLNTANRLTGVRLPGSAPTRIVDATPAERRAAGMIARDLEATGTNVDDVVRARRNVVLGSRQNGEAAQETLFEMLDLERAGRGARRSYRERGRGAALEGRARASANIAGPSQQRAREFLETRSRGATDDLLSGANSGGAGRVVETLRRVLQSDPVDIPAALRAIDDEMRIAAQSRYREAYAQSVDPDVLFPLYDADMLRPAARRARDLLRGSQDAGASEARRALDAMMSDETLGRLDSVPIMAVDYLQRALSDVIGQAQRTGAGNRVRMLAGLRSRFLEPVDAAAPAFGNARNAWHVGQNMREALEAGRHMLREMPAELAERVVVMNAAERRAYQLGVAESIANVALSSDNASRAVTRLLRNPITRQRMRAAFDNDQAFEQFVQRLVREARMLETERAFLQGSRTTPLAEEISWATQGDSAGAVLREEIGRGLESGGVRGAAGQIWRGWVRRLYDAITQPGLRNREVNEAFGDMVFRPYPRGSRDFTRVSNLLRDAQAERAMRSAALPNARGAISYAAAAQTPRLADQAGRR